MRSTKQKSGMTKRRSLSKEHQAQNDPSNYCLGTDQQLLHAFHTDHHFPSSLPDQRWMAADYRSNDDRRNPLGTIYHSHKARLLAFCNRMVGCSMRNFDFPVCILVQLLERKSCGRFPCPNANQSRESKETNFA